MRGGAFNLLKTVRIGQKAREDAESRVARIPKSLSVL
jgi:hypothetical protein